MKRLQSRVALITGAASGIGRACAIRFIEEGASVFLTDLNKDAGEQLLTELAAGEAAEFMAADVSQAADIDNLVATALARFGRLDICVCSAGVGPQPGPFYEADIDDFDRVMGVNVRGPFLLGQQVAKHMMAASIPGSIIHISSVGGELAVPEVPAYCVSKAALNMLTKVMAVTLGPRGIRVNAIGPGATNTAMTAAGHALPAVQARMKSRTPLGRFAEAEEMASIAAFLASSDASYITGQTLYADGGRMVLNYTMPDQPPPPV